MNHLCWNLVAYCAKEDDEENRVGFHCPAASAYRIMEEVWGELLNLDTHYRPGFQEPLSDNDFISGGKISELQDEPRPRTLRVFESRDRQAKSRYKAFCCSSDVG